MHDVLLDRASAHVKEVAPEHQDGVHERVRLHDEQLVVRKPRIDLRGEPLTLEPVGRPLRILLRMLSNQGDEVPRKSQRLQLSARLEEDRVVVGEERLARVARVEREVLRQPRNRARDLCNDGSRLVVNDLDASVSDVREGRLMVVGQQREDGRDDRPHRGRNGHTLVASLGTERIHVIAAHGCTSWFKFISRFIE